MQTGKVKHLSQKEFWLPERYGKSHCQREQSSNSLSRIALMISLIQRWEVWCDGKRDTQLRRKQTGRRGGLTREWGVCAWEAEVLINGKWWLGRNGMVFVPEQMAHEGGKPGSSITEAMEAKPPWHSHACGRDLPQQAPKKAPGLYRAVQHGRIS